MGSHKGQPGVSSSVPNPGSTQVGLEVREEGDDDKESSDILGSQLEGGLGWQGRLWDSAVYLEFSDRKSVV